MFLHLQPLWPISASANRLQAPAMWLLPLHGKLHETSFTVLGLMICHLFLKSNSRPCTRLCKRNLEFLPVKVPQRGTHRAAGACACTCVNELSLSRIAYRLFGPGEPRSRCLNEQVGVSLHSSRIAHWECKSHLRCNSGNSNSKPLIVQARHTGSCYSAAYSSCRIVPLES